MGNQFDLGITIRLGRGIKTDAEKASEKLRQAAGLHPADPLPAVKAAELMGVQVINPHHIPGITADILEALEEEEDGSSSWSAAYIATPETADDLIVNNRVHGPRRGESNVYHELGHQVCGHKPDRIEWIHGLPIREFSKEKENQANVVAHALHVPKTALVKMLYAQELEEEFRDRFAVSKQLFDVRMRMSGVRGMKRHISR